MKDERGLYYYPSLQSRATRMYVREEAGTLLFRLWSDDNPAIWDKHGWITRQAVEQAAERYKERGQNRNPLGLYDLTIARRLVDDDRTA
jgi:hypothetical protein